MAPRKKETQKPLPALAATRRVTRSATKNDRTVLTPPLVHEPHRKRKPAAGKQKAEESDYAKGRAKKGKATESDDAKGKAKQGKDKKDVKGRTRKSDDAEKKAKTVVIVVWKHNILFRRKAYEVQDCLESALPGITVEVNPEKPQAEQFEIRNADGEIFFSLSETEPPYQQLKDLDPEEVALDIIKKLNE